MQLNKELLAKLDSIQQGEEYIQQLAKEYEAAEVAREEARNRSVSLRVQLEEAKKALDGIKHDFATATIQERTKR